MALSKGKIADPKTHDMDPQQWDPHCKHPNEDTLTARSLQRHGQQRASEYVKQYVKASPNAFS